MKKNNHKSGCNAVALLAILWSILIISSVVIGTIFVVKNKLDKSSKIQNEFEAELLAKRGLAIAQHPKIKRNDPLLNHNAGNGNYIVKINRENGKIHLNEHLIKGKDKILKKLFIKWGMKFDTASSFIDALKDWVDEDDFTHLNGAEKGEYENLGKVGLPFNKPFSSLNDVKLVIGYENLEKVKPKWQNYFTLWSNGKINLNESDPNIIYATTNATEENIEQFLKLLKGEDEIRGTKDDQIPTTVDEALSILGLNSDEIKKISPFLSIKSNTLRIESVGIVFDSIVQIDMVYRRVGFNKQIYHYKRKILR